MTTPESTPAANPSPAGHTPPTARSEFFGACAWIALGVAIAIGSWTMDRLEQQHINPYTVPGLLPGLLGLMMILLGSILSLRSVRRGALQAVAAPASAD